MIFKDTLALKESIIPYQVNNSISSQ